MSAAAVMCFPPRLRAVPPASTLDRLLADGTLDERQHAAGLAYRDLRQRFEAACRSARRGGAGLSLPEGAWRALEARHAALLRAAGAERVRAALGRVAGIIQVEPC